MKYIILVFWLLISFKGLPQGILEESPLTSYSFEKIENPIFEKDSLVITESEKSFNSEIFKEFGEDAENYIYNYQNTVFLNSLSTSKRKYYIQQWMSPILIYFDKSIPRALKKSLINLVEQIEDQDIQNLSISFVKDIDDANYLIKSTNKTFDVNYNFKSEEEKKNYVFNNGSYKLITGNAKKPRGCILELNTDNGQSLDIMKKNLNQLFFLSLGRFIIFNNLEYEDSFLNAYYQYSEKLTEPDIAILKIHYSVIFNSPLTQKEFKKIIKPNP